MAFSATYLTRMYGANGWSKWRYDTLDTHATVDTDAYFSTDEAVAMLKVGDLFDVVVWATAIRTGTVSTYGSHIVLSNDGTTVDIGDVTVGTVTDTD